MIVFSLFLLLFLVEQNSFYSNIFCLVLNFLLNFFIIVFFSFDEGILSEEH